MVVSELRGEKIDIIPYNDEPARFVAKALSPARVREVLVDDETKEATVIVPDDQLSLAIGRDGQNARLAARLTGWKVDITSETEFAQQEEDIEYEGEEAADGRCMAVMTTGRRCPNAALQGSQFCGLPQHQALARFDTNQVTVVTALTDDEVSVLADPNADDAQLRPLVERATAALAEQESTEEGDAEESETSDADQAVEELEEAKEQAEVDVAEAEEELAEAEDEAAEVAEADDGAEEAEEADDGAEEAEGGESESGEAEGEASDDEVEPEQALAEDAATEGEAPSPEAATGGAHPSEEPKAPGEDSEGSRPEGA
jgi:N utilization substance protein A